MTDCYEHIEWGDKRECQAFCKPALVAASAVGSTQQPNRAAGEGGLLSNWTCDDCSCQSDNPKLWECCNGAKMTDCYE